MRISEYVYELMYLMILLSITTTNSTQQYYKLDGKANYKNTYKTRQLSPYLLHTGTTNTRKYDNNNNNNDKNDIKIKQFTFDDSNYQYYYYDSNSPKYSYSYSYSNMQAPSQWYSYSYSYYYSIVYIETKDHTTTDDDSITHNDSYQGIIKFFIAGFVTITFVYFYRSYHLDKRNVQESGYEMVNVIGDVDDSNLDDDDDDINEKITHNDKTKNIKDLKYISVSTKEDSS